MILTETIVYDPGTEDVHHGILRDIPIEGLHTFVISNQVGGALDLLDASAITNKTPAAASPEPSVGHPTDSPTSLSRKYSIEPSQSSEVEEFTGADRPDGESEPRAYGSGEWSMWRDTL